MPVNEIPRSTWEPFCDGFSRQHQGWIVDLEAADSGHQVEAPASELEAEIVSYNHFGTPASAQAATAAPVQPKTLRQGVVLRGVQVARCPSGEEQIVVTADTRDGKQLTHAIQEPARLRIERTETGADEALYIDTKRHTVAVRFPVTAPMEALNGFVSE